MAKSLRPLGVRAALVALMATIGACGSSNGDRKEMSGDDSKGGRTVDITTMHQYSPREVTIKAGESITWKNSSNAVHTVTVDPSKVKTKENVSMPPGAKAFHSGDLAPGKTYRQTFTIAGTYRYVCLYHEDKDMIGTIIVKPSETGSPNPY
jgi:plastocyanin